MAEDGDLVMVPLSRDTSEITLRHPYAYQGGAGGRREIASRYVVRGRTQVRLQLGPYDRNCPLVIDPAIGYSLTIGHSGSIGGIAVGDAGSLYIAGATDDPDLATTPGAFQPDIADDPKGEGDAFVAKLAEDGSLTYCTYLGGKGRDWAYDVAVDADGNAFVTGYTLSRDFPTTVGAFQPSFAGMADAFVVKLDPGGSNLVYSSFIGGGDRDEGHGIALDHAGNAYVGGWTGSSDFPTRSAFQGRLAGEIDGFVTKVNQDGSALVYSTYLGGGGLDGVLALDVDAVGHAFVVGQALNSIDFPTRKPFQAALQGFADGFVTKLAPDGADLVFSTLLGGSSDEAIFDIVVDSFGCAYVSGQTDSADLPVKDAVQATYAGSWDAFVAKLDASGSALDYSTYLGGSGWEGRAVVGTDAAGRAVVVGATHSTDYPVQDAVQPLFGGGASDAFITRLDAAGSGLLYSTYLGGSDDDFNVEYPGPSVAVDSCDRVVVGGNYGYGLPRVRNDPWVFRLADHSVTCPADVVAECSSDTDPVVTGEPSLEGYCSPATCGYEDAVEPHCKGTATVTRTWTCTGAGDVGSCGQVLELVDTTPPEVTVGKIRVCYRTPSEAESAARWATIANDACGDVRKESRLDGWCAAVVSVTAIDSCGNAADPVEYSTRMDGTAPKIAGVPADATVECDAVPSPASPVVTDDCDPAPALIFDEVRTGGTCPQAYTLTRTWTATDVCPNSSSAVQVVSVVDTTAPAILGVPADVTVECDAVPPPATPSVADNCDPVPKLEFAEVRTDGACPQAYTLTRTWTATDSCGNNRTAVQVVSVVDSTAPAIVGVPPDVTVECDAVLAPATPSVGDNCDPAPRLTFRETRTDGSCEDRYRLDREWSAADACGNASRAGHAVAVVDTTAPEPSGALVPVEPLPPRPAVPPGSACSPPNERLLRVECEPLTDNCDPTPLLTASLRVENHDVPEWGECVPRADEIGVECDELVEVHLVAPPCPAKPPKGPVPALSVSSAGLKVVTGERVVLELAGTDRCSNRGVFAYDPAVEPSPLCDEVLADGTCCPAMGPPPPPRCMLAPCGTGPPSPPFGEPGEAHDATGRSSEGEEP